MDPASPFGILSLEEFDGLSLEEKLAYVDLQLTHLSGKAWRERFDDNPEDAAKEPALHH